MYQLLLHTFADAEAICQAAAREFTLRALEGITGRGRFHVALSGGSTPKRLYELLAGPPFRQQIDWNCVHLFWGDERCVPPTDPQSNYHMTHEAMLRFLPLPAENVHRLQAERAERDAAARDYQEQIAHAFGVSANGEPPVFDLILLGLGPDGHTASLFPETEALAEQHRWVVPNYVPKFNAYRLTLTVPILNQARQVLFLVAGPDKAGPLLQVFTGPRNPAHLPAQLIRPVNGQLTWFVDRAAVQQLTAGLGE